MPKLRNATSDVAKFAQWIGRKVRNHNPLEELKLSAAAQAKLPRMHKPKVKGDVFVMKSDPSTIVCMANNGRAFKMSLIEIEPGDVPEDDLVAVGF